MRTPGGHSYRGDQYICRDFTLRNIRFSKRFSKKQRFLMVLGEVAKGRVISVQCARALPVPKPALRRNKKGFTRVSSGLPWWLRG